MTRFKPTMSVRTEYQTTRTSHHVCFGCRKQFHKPVESLVLQNLLRHVGRTVAYDTGTCVYPCPQCAQPMTHLGKNFRPPPQDDLEGWEVARRLSNAGFRYAHTWGPYPTKLKDVTAFIEQHRVKSEGELVLKGWQKK